LIKNANIKKYKNRYRILGMIMGGMEGGETKAEEGDEMHTEDKLEG
jgi:hypothetical protein